MNQIEKEMKIEEDVGNMFTKMEKPFHEYYGEHCPVFDPECLQCKATLIFAKFKKELWEQCVLEDQER